jgi:hypothetical protein
VARKFEPVLGKFAWKPERSEETIIITSYSEIRKFISPDQRWPDEFELHFYQRGDGVAFTDLKKINDEPLRKKLKLIILRETDVGDHAREFDRSVRAQRRRDLRDELADLNPEALRGAIARAHEEVAALLPPHRTYTEYREERASNDQENRLSRVQVAQRVLAQRQDQKAAQVDARINKITRMLSLASDPALHGEIIKVLSADEALTLAGQIDVPDIRNALVRHSLSSMGTLPAVMSSERT